MDKNIKPEAGTIGLTFEEYVQKVSGEMYGEHQAERALEIEKLLLESPDGKIVMPASLGRTEIIDYSRDAYKLLAGTIEGNSSRYIICDDLLNQKCRICGCSWFNACPGGCWWVEKDLCSACYDRLMSTRWGRLRLKFHAFTNWLLGEESEVRGNGK